MEEFITAATFNYPHEITILKHRLELENIPHFFENEATTSVAPFYSIALGGIKLKVHPADLQAVKAILDDLNNRSQLTIV